MAAALIYSVSVVYDLNGFQKTYIGRFVGRNAGEAVRNGVEFVVKYIKPNFIIGSGLTPEISDIGSGLVLYGVGADDVDTIAANDVDGIAA